MAVFVNLPAPEGKQVLFVRDRARAGIALADACFVLSRVLSAVTGCDFYHLYYSCSAYGLLQGWSIFWTNIAAEQKRAIRQELGYQKTQPKTLIVPEGLVYLFQRCLYVHARKLDQQTQEWVDNVLSPMYRHSTTSKEAFSYAKAQDYAVCRIKGDLPWSLRTPAFDGFESNRFSTLDTDLRSYFKATGAGEAKVNELRYFVEMDVLDKWLATKVIQDSGIPAPEIEPFVTARQAQPKAKATSTSISTKSNASLEQIARENYLNELHTKVRASIDAIKGSTPCYCEGKFFSAPDTPLWDSAPSYSSRFKAAHKKAS